MFSEIEFELNVNCCSDEMLTRKKGCFCSGIFDEIHLLRLASEHDFPLPIIFKIMLHCMCNDLGASWE